MKRFLFLFFVLFLLEVQAGAWTYIVKPTGNDSYDGKSLDSAWQTITKGCTEALAGDTVYIRYGVYAESSGGAWTACKYIYYDGQSKADTVCRGCGALNPKYDGSEGNYIVYKNYPGDARPIIMGNYHGYDYSQYGAYIQDKSYIHFDSLVIKKSFRGIFIDVSDHIKITNCVVCTTGGPCTDSGGGDNSGGVFVGYVGDYGTTYACTVTTCSLFTNWSYADTGKTGNLAPNLFVDDFNNSGIHSYFAKACYFYNNDIFDQPTGSGIRMKARDTTITISTNRVHDCATGIAVGTDGKDQDVTENLVWSCGDAGIQISPYNVGATDVRVWNNTVYGNTGSGIKIEDSGGGCSACSIWNNIAANCGAFTNNGFVPIELSS